MTSIDFYILKTEVFRDYLNFIGKLTEKAYLKNHDVFIHTNDEELMIKVDEALWSFRENSFLPHCNEKSFNNEEKKSELKDYVKNKIAPFKYPRWIEFVNELPKTATGKIQRFKLRENF